MSEDHHNENNDFNEKASGWHHALGFGDSTASVAPFVPTPFNVIRRMLELAEVGPEDVIYDLGCGDGRILITAVQEFGVKKAVGFELTPQMVEATSHKIREMGLDDKIKIVNENFFESDLSGATVITLYLTTSGNAKLKPKLIEELPDGARIVSHDFPIMDWVTIREDGKAYQLGTHKIFLYKLPHAYAEDNTIEPEPEENRWDRIKQLFDRLERG